MGMVRGETRGGRGTRRARGEPVAAVTISASAAYDAHHDALRAYLERYTGDRADAEDLVHEAFVRLITESAAGRRPAHVRAWLYRVAVNLATSRARRRGVATRRASELLAQDVVPSPEDVLLDREVVSRLNGQLAGLSDDARTALVLAAHGFSGAEIARHIGRTELATRSMLSRQRSRLRANAEPSAAA